MVPWVRKPLLKDNILKITIYLEKKHGILETYRESHLQ